MTKSSLLERVRAGLVVNKPGIQPWHRTLPKPYRDELVAVKKWFRRDGTGTPIRSVARSIVEQLQAAKIRCPAIQTVETWLRSDD